MTPTGQEKSNYKEKLKEDDKKVIGRLYYDVFIDCPHCRESVNLIDLQDDECQLGKAVFGGIETPAKWENIDIDYNCLFCGEKFTLIEIEY